MRRLLPSLLPVLGTIAVFATSTAHARELEYRAPGGSCPAQGEVAARIDARAPEGRAIRVDVQPTASGFRGEVVVGEGERRSVRSVEARACDAVIEALTLLVALDRDEPEPPASQRDEAPAERATSPRPAAAPTMPVQSTADGRDDLAGARSPKERGPLAGVFGTSVRTGSFAGGKMLFGNEVFAELAAPGGALGVRWLKPAMRASFVRMRSIGWAERSGVQPHVVAMGGALDLCALTTWSDDDLTVAACSRTELASLDVGVEGNDASSRTHLWATTGGVGRARWSFATRTIVRPIVEVTGGLLATLTRDHLHFAGHDPVVASPWLWTAAIAAGVELR